MSYAPWQLLYLATSTSVTTATTATLQDGGLANYSLVVSNPNALYRLKYIARAATDTAATVGDLQIRDGGASAPTTSSTVVAAASMYLAAAGGPGATQVIVEGVIKLAVGTHVLGCFYGKTAGAGTFSVAQSGGQLRTFTVELAGTG